MYHFLPSFSSLFSWDKLDSQNCHCPNKNNIDNILSYCSKALDRFVTPVNRIKLLSHWCKIGCGKLRTHRENAEIVHNATDFLATDTVDSCGQECMWWALVEFMISPHCTWWLHNARDGTVMHVFSPLTVRHQPTVVRSQAEGGRKCRLQKNCESTLGATLFITFPQPSAVNFGVDEQWMPCSRHHVCFQCVLPTQWSTAIYNACVKHVNSAQMSTVCTRMSATSPQNFPQPACVPHTSHAIRLHGAHTVHAMCMLSIVCISHPP